MGIVVMKLITGEEVIAGREENLSGKTVFTKPRVFLTQQTSQGIGAALVPWIWSAPDESVELNSTTILATVGASKQLEDSYLQHTSGIDLTATKL
jgi:hypothetical protein